MGFRIHKAQIYGFKTGSGKARPDYIIMNGYDGRFLEWREVEPTGIREIDENIGCDGSVVVHKRAHAKKIIEKLYE